MNFMLLTFFLGVIFAGAFLFLILKYAYKHQLYDFLDGRKEHSALVPRLGGLSFAPAVVAVLAIMCSVMPDMDVLSPKEERMAWCYLLALCVIYIEGATDDIAGLNYKIKFLCQFLSASIVVFSGTYLSDIHTFLGIDHGGEWIDMLFSVLLVVFIINAMNLIDGIDGLASGLGIFISLAYGAYFHWQQRWWLAISAVALCGAIIPFFLCNVWGREDKKQKMFMGDCGSQTMGLLFGIYALELPVASSAGADMLLVSYALLMIPCLDVIRVMLGRILRGKNPFLPDKTHIHHKMVALGLSHKATSCVLVFMAVILFFFTIWVNDRVNAWGAVAASLVLWVLFLVALSRLSCHGEACRSSKAVNKGKKF